MRVNPKTVSHSKRLSIEVRNKARNLSKKLSFVVVASMVSNLRAKPMPKMFNRHKIRRVRRKRLKRNSQSCRCGSNRLSTVVRSTIPDEFERKLGKLKTQSLEHFDSRLLIGNLKGKDTDLTEIVKIQTKEGDFLPAR